ncbi:hypothetical protein LR48_Vigan02g158100 [Vigna angularis]|uniref:Uncharacterized protein n=1 Tax=Phaseolus angularis TaxID=3914 RepID=A0A0L9TY41_PHAAN|nr:hypothetical protein LR48_Vigan02g158100 [Vigna angularis]
MSLFQLKSLHFPCEIRVIYSKTAKSSSFQEPDVFTLELQINGNHSWPEVKVFIHKLQNVLVMNLSCAKSVNKQIMSQQQQLRMISAQCTFWQVHWPHFSWQPV